jgi:RNA polymerase sigma factor (sigma-70 family)
MCEPCAADCVPMLDAVGVDRANRGYEARSMRTASIQTSTATAGPRGSRRLLALAGDERLVEQIRRGNEAAFEVAFERHGPAILGFCRHMLRSPEEAEDAVQHTFAAAHRDLLRESDRAITLKPWLFTIARNRCLSMLRARRELPMEDAQLPTVGLAEQVEQRAELRQLLTDLGQLPGEQRVALLLAEIGDLSHSEIARVLGCEVPRVKALVFRARSGLIQRREARETPCESIQEQLATMRGGSLRRTELRLHLRGCVACRAYRDEVKRQRQLLAAALPVAPSVALKSSVLAAVGVGGGSTGGGVAAGLTSIAGAFSGATGGAVVAKVALVAVLAGGGAVAGQAVLDSSQNPGSATPPTTVKAPAAAAQRSAQVDSAAASAPVPVGTKEASSGQTRRSRSGGKDTEPRARGGNRSTDTGLPPGQAKSNGSRALGHGQEAGKSKSPRGKARGPLEGPPASTPVRRGPPEPRPAPKAQPSPQAKPAPSVKAEAPAGTPPATPAPGAPANTQAPGAQTMDVEPQGANNP